MRIRVGDRDYFVQWAHYEHPPEMFIEKEIALADGAVLKQLEPAPDRLDDFLINNKIAPYQSPKSITLATTCTIRTVDLDADGKKVYSDFVGGRAICMEDDAYTYQKQYYNYRFVDRRAELILHEERATPVPRTKLKFQGRKRSLEQALTKAGFDKGVRGLFWAEFHKQWPARGFDLLGILQHKVKNLTAKVDAYKAAEADRQRAKKEQADAMVR